MLVVGDKRGIVEYVTLRMKRDTPTLRLLRLAASKSDMEILVFAGCEERDELSCVQIVNHSLALNIPAVILEFVARRPPTTIEAGRYRVGVSTMLTVEGDLLILHYTSMGGFDYHATLLLLYRSRRRCNTYHT